MAAATAPDWVHNATRAPHRHVGTRHRRAHSDNSPTQQQRPGQRHCASIPTGGPGFGTQKQEMQITSGIDFQR